MAVTEDNRVAYKILGGKVSDVATGKQLSYTHIQGTLTIKLSEETSLILPNENYSILE